MTMGNDDFELSKRKENQRNKNAEEVIRFSLSEIMLHFDDAIAIIERQYSIADELMLQDKELDAKNIWRAQVVFLSSALDFYMHEIAKFVLANMFDARIGATEKYGNIMIPMRIFEDALITGEGSYLFLEYINQVYSSVTMVSYGEIKEILKLIGIDASQIANDAFYKRGSVEKPIKKMEERLDRLYYRRNRIAHQTDRKHTNAQTEDITKAQVEEFISDIKRIVKAIDKEVRAL